MEQLFYRFQFLGQQESSPIDESKRQSCEDCQTAFFVKNE